MDPHTAYTALLMRHRNMLWGLCWQRAGGDRDRCCDLLQEVSIALWENFGKLRPDATSGQERAWVRWQARSVFYQIDRRQVLPTAPLSDRLSNSVAEEDARQRKETLEELLSSLDPDEQRMLRMYLEGYRGEEISAAMGISRNNFYQRMHRAILKMRSVALIVLALVFASGVAIAIAPQWRHLIFVGGEPEDTVPDTHPVPPKAAAPVAPPRDTVAPPPTARPDTLPPRETVEYLPPLVLSGEMSAPRKMPSRMEHDSVTISVDGTRLVITGAEGEWIRVYDYGGMLVASQMASRICIIDLYPSLNHFAKKCFRLKIGNRTPLQLQL